MKERSRAMRIASAPVSYGVFGGSAIDMEPVELLAAMAAAGYRGSELGPPGFFGSPDHTARLFAEHGLTVVGAYVPLHLSQSDQVLAADLAAMGHTLEELQASGNPEVVAVLADEGDEDLRARPWRRPGERGMDHDIWQRAAERIMTACETVRSHGVTPVFHPHYATYVEQPDEIDTLLARTDVDLCLDSGHFTLGGADPADYARKYASRIKHVHLKDVSRKVVKQAQERGEADLDSWWADVSCPLGQGDVELSRLLAELEDYRGWYVIEQDRAPVTPETWDTAVADQARNLEWLANR